MVIIDRICVLLKDKGLKQKDLTDYIGISKNVFTDWKSGKNSSYMKHLPKIAEFFNVTVDQLISGEDAPKSAPKIKEEPQFRLSDINENITLIPMYESISAGYGAYADSKIIGYTPFVLDNNAEKDDYFSIIVEGDSMSPKIEDGDIIIVRRQPTVQDGQIAAVMVESEGFVKRVFFGKNKVILRSYNPMYEDRVYEGIELEQVRICGIVKAIHTNL